IGALGMSKANPKWIKPNILSINRDSLNHVRASFAAFSEKINIEKVSGTLKGLGKK
ncbi:unnamed protein product, partial [marine sediment metagenome]